MNSPNHASPEHTAPNTTTPVRCPSATGGDNLFLGPTWPETKLGRLMVTSFGRLLASAARGTDFLRNVGSEIGAPAAPRTEDETLSRWIDAKGWPARPLQISVFQSGDWAEDLVAASGVFRPEWTEVPSARLHQGSLTDALVRRTDDGGLTITTRESAGREAAWFDWSSERPFSYPAVFPTRVDAAHVTIAPDALGNTDPLIARLLVEAAALCSRTPERLTLEDRINGRNVGWSRYVKASVDGQPITLAHNADTDPLTLVIRALTEAIASADQTTRTSPAARAACRLISAWAVTARSVEPSIVRAAAETAWDVNKDEAETALRVAAVRLAQLDDPAGLAALEHAATLVQGLSHPFAQEQVDFVVSELKTQSDTPEGVARVAAGITLVASSFPPEHLRHFKQDLLDDARFSGVLVGQDQDTHLILQVFRMLERRAGILYLPARPQTWTGSIEPQPTPDERATLTPPIFTFPKAEVAKRTAKRVRAPKNTRPKTTRPAVKPTPKPAPKSGKTQRTAARISSAAPRRKAA